MRTALERESAKAFQIVPLRAGVCVSFSGRKPKAASSLIAPGLSSETQVTSDNLMRCASCRAPFSKVASEEHMETYTIARVSGLGCRGYCRELRQLSLGLNGFEA